MSKTMKTLSEKASDALKSAGQTVHDAAVGTVHAVDETATAIGAAVGDAAKATGDYLTHSKHTAVKAAHETLDGIEEKWLDLQAKAAPTADKAKADFQKAKDQMTQTLANAKAKLVEARDAGVDAWQQNVRPALDADLQKAQELYRDAAARFSGNQPV